MNKAQRRQLKKLRSEVKALQRSGTTDVLTALRLLADVAAFDPQTLPTRQQRRAAERKAAKRGAK